MRKTELEELQELNIARKIAGLKPLDKMPRSSEHFHSMSTQRARIGERLRKEQKESQEMEKNETGFSYPTSHNPS